MVGNALEICKQIGENKAELNRAAAALQALDMLCFQFRAQIIHNILQRFNARSERNVVVEEGARGKIQHFCDGGDDHIKLIEGGG